MVEIRVGSWWRSKFTDKIATVIAVRNDLVTALWPDGSSGYVSTKIFLRDFKHLPHCTGFDWVPVSRWFVNNTGDKKFRDGTLVVEQDQYGKVYAHEAERRSGELKAYQDGTLEQLVRRKEWREIPEAEAAAILEKARKPAPKDRYYQNPSGFKNGTLFRLRDTDGNVWSVLAGGQKRLHGKWQEHHDRYVKQGLWVEVTEEFVNRTLDAEFPEKPDFPEQENAQEQETAPSINHFQLGSGQVLVYIGCNENGEGLILLRHESHGETDLGKYEIGNYQPGIKDGDVYLTGPPEMIRKFTEAITAGVASATARLNSTKNCSGSCCCN